MTPSLSEELLPLNSTGSFTTGEAGVNENPATGARFAIVTDVAAGDVSPSLSVTIRVTTYGPSSMYTCVATAVRFIAPSPQAIR